MIDAFFEQLERDLFRSTKWTIGPWGPDSQHAGPPSALLGRAVEEAGARDDMNVARMTIEILRPVPIADLRVEAAVVRPGRSVQLVEADLFAGDDRVMSARGWMIRSGSLDLPKPAPSSPPELPDTSAGGISEGEATDYLHAMEWRFVEGSFFENGPATAWLRMRYPLVAGETVSALGRVLVAADSGNGISGALDFTKWVYVNPDLTVYLHRPLEGEWVCLEARTIPEATGIGLAHATVYDRRGPIGKSAQSLFLASRK